MRRIKEDRNGFTLVEVLTVLVIIAILAAVAIPTMGGFITDAKTKSYTGQARSVYLAAQAAAIELADSENTSVKYTSGDHSAFVESVSTLLGEDVPADCSYTITLEGSKVIQVEYIAPGGAKITIAGGESVSYENN